MNKALSTGVERDGDLLVVTEEATLPPRCPLCNEPCAPEGPLAVQYANSRKRGIGAQLTAAAMDKMRGWNYTGPVALAVPLCTQHRNRRKIALMIAGGVLLVFGITAAIMAAMGYRETPLAMPIIPAGLALFVIIAVVSGNLNLWMKAKKFDDRRVWLKGASPAYLASLPQAR